MENKYYIPLIEEFAFGFEYEYLERHTEREDFYVPQTITKYSNIDLFDSEIKSGLIRIKYLDKEDIGSLGWKFEKTFDDGKSKGMFQHHLFKKDGFNLHFIGKIIITKDSHTLFDGFINNKSELKKLQFQLNIV